MTLRSTLLIAAAALALTSATSCVRDYTCECKIKYTGQPGLPDSLIKDYTVRDTKSNAKSLCEQNSSSKTANGIKTTEDCKLF